MTLKLWRSKLDHMIYMLVLIVLMMVFTAFVLRTAERIVDNATRAVVATTSAVDMLTKIMQRRFDYLGVVSEPGEPPVTLTTEDSTDTTST